MLLTSASNFMSYSIQYSTLTTSVKDFDEIQLRIRYFNKKWHSAIILIYHSVLDILISFSAQYLTLTLSVSNLLGISDLTPSQ